MWPVADGVLTVCEHSSLRPSKPPVWVGLGAVCGWQAPLCVSPVFSNHVEVHLWTCSVLWTVVITLPGCSTLALERHPAPPATPWALHRPAWCPPARPLAPRAGVAPRTAGTPPACTPGARHLCPAMTRVPQCPWHRDRAGGDTGRPCVRPRSCLVHRVGGSLIGKHQALGPTCVMASAASAASARGGVTASEAEQGRPSGEPTEHRGAVWSTASSHGGCGGHQRLRSGSDPTDAIHV